MQSACVLTKTACQQYTVLICDLPAGWCSLRWIRASCTESLIATPLPVCQNLMHKLLKRQLLQRDPVAWMAQVSSLVTSFFVPVLVMLL